MPCHRTCIVSMVRPAPRGELHRPADTLPPALLKLVGRTFQSVSAENCRQSGYVPCAALPYWGITAYNTFYKDCRAGKLLIKRLQAKHIFSRFHTAAAIQSKHQAGMFIIAEVRHAANTKCR